MSEDLGAYLEVPQRVSILEEALSIESIFSDNFTEVLDNLQAELSISRVSLSPSVNSLCAHIANCNVKVLLEALLGEDLVDSVGELSPLDMLAFLRCLEHCLKHIELALRNGALCHGKSNSELLGSDEARSESIEVTEELGDADALLLAQLSDSSNHIVFIIWLVANNLSFADACLSLREVVCAMIEALVDSKELFGAIDILREVDIIDLIDVTFVHVAAKEGLKDVLGSTDPEQVKDAKELILGHVAIARDIVVLEHGLQVNALVLDCRLVLLQDHVDFMIILLAGQVLTAGEKSVTLGHGWHSRGWSLVDAGNGEGAVHVCAEICVSEEPLRVISLILLGQ